MNARQIAKSICNGPRSVFPIRRYLSVPNVYWGWGLDYEADIIILSKSRLAREIEIKCTKSDLYADLKKKKHKRTPDPRITKFYYAVPESLVAELENPIFPSSAGIIKVVENTNNGDIKSYIVREAQELPNTRKTSLEEEIKLLRLAAMRIWR